MLFLFSSSGKLQQILHRDRHHDNKKLDVLNYEYVMPKELTSVTLYLQDPESQKSTKGSRLHGTYQIIL